MLGALASLVDDYDALEDEFLVSVYFILWQKAAHLTYDLHKTVKIYFTNSEIHMSYVILL